MFHVEPSTQETLQACPICGSPTFGLFEEVVDQSVSHEKFSLVDCSACGFRFTNPRPTKETIGKYYASEDYISHTNARTSLMDRLYQIARRHAIRTKHHLIRNHRNKGRVLDIGCGTGEFLAYLSSRGYMVDGVEPSLIAREKAIANHSLTVVPTLEQIPSHEQYQLVTLWHVLEHLHDLRSTLKKIHSISAENAHVFIAVPDRQCWDAAYYGAKWAAWDVPRHLSHLRCKDVHRLLQEHGFDPIETHRMWLDAYYVAMLSELYKGSPRPVAMIKGFIVGMRSNLVALFSRRSTSSTLFVARKATI